MNPIPAGALAVELVSIPWLDRRPAGHGGAHWQANRRAVCMTILSRGLFCQEQSAFMMLRPPVRWGRRVK